MSKTGISDTYDMVIPCQGQNALDEDEITEHIKNNLKESLNYLICEFEHDNKKYPTVINLPYNLLSIMRELVSKTENCYISSDEKFYFRGIQIKGGCDMKSPNICITYWSERTVNVPKTFTGSLKKFERIQKEKVETVEKIKENS